MYRCDCENRFSRNLRKTHVEESDPGRKAEKGKERPESVQLKGVEGRAYVGVREPFDVTFATRQLIA